MDKKSNKKSDKKLQEEVEEPREEVESSYNTAVVYRGKSEVRKYTLEIHGEGFKTLAENFIIKKGKGYGVVMKEIRPGITCPSCGHVIYEEK